MSTFYAPGCKDEKAHTCDMCEINDGRPTIYWKDKDFDLCRSCLETLCKEHLDLKALSKKVTVIRSAIPESLRNKIFERDGHACVECGSTQRLCLDHKDPFSFGGKTEENNLRTLCTSCNSKKGNR